MLKQASVSQIRKGQLTKKDGYLVIAMCFYPRGLKKDLWDEYRVDLAPDRTLFQEWKDFESSVGHEEAFKKSNYESRFELGRRALAHLEGLCKMSREQDVYLICQCEKGERCHREILLLIGEKIYGAPAEPIHNTYPQFEQRLQDVMKATLQSR